MDSPQSLDRGQLDGANLVVSRWRRYGKDHLYVARADGTKLGRLDLLSGEIAVEQPAIRSELIAAACRWGDTNAVDVRSLLPTELNGIPPDGAALPDTPAHSLPPPPPSNDPPPPPPNLAAPPRSTSAGVTGDADWVDLAGNRAGQAAREQAVELRQAAPVRTFVARALQVHTDERAWRIGADGEEALARRLRKLGNEWRILHAVPVGDNGSDIDHVVIGPGGVFTLNTKNHSGKKVWVSETTLMVGGHRTQYLRNSRFEGTRAADLLSRACGFDVAVKAVIVVLCDELTIKAVPEDVAVTSIRAIRKWLQRQPAVLGSVDVEAIYEQARRGSTWHPGASA